MSPSCSGDWSWFSEMRPPPPPQTPLMVLLGVPLAPLALLSRDWG